MTAPPIAPQSDRAHPHPHTQSLITLIVSPTVMPAHAGIQRLGLCGVRS